MFTDLGQPDIYKRSRFDLDPLGRLVGFESGVRVAGLIDAIKVQGVVEGTNLKLSIQSGDFREKMERYLPPNALMTDELSPQSRLPGLRVGQSWTVPMYSPFRAPNDPLEVLQAVVEREDNITWNGEQKMPRDCLSTRRGFWHVEQRTARPRLGARGRPGAAARGHGLAIALAVRAHDRRESRGTGGDLGR